MDVQTILDQYPLPHIRLFDRQVFIRYLQTIYGVVISSEPLLERAIERTIERDLHDYYKEHLIEEHDHAKWFREDLLVLNAFPLPVHWGAALFVGPQYYLLENGPSSTLLGYIAVLECRPMDLNTVAALEDHYGREPLRAIRYHSEHDPEHKIDVLKMIDSLWEPQWELVMKNVALVASSLPYLFEGIDSRAKVANAFS
ncbi:MAG: hypothetical protein ACRD5H_01255 [Nitrososphaerales archaeon]